MVNETTMQVIMIFFFMQIFYKFINTHCFKEDPHKKDLKITRHWFHLPAA